jgi:hypothetical protein
MFPFMDRAFGTALSPDAAQAQIARHLERHGGGAA